MDRHRWAATVLGFAGVLVIVRPGGDVAHWAAVLPLVAALSFAGFRITTRLLARTEPMPATLFQCGAGSFVRASAAVPFVWQPMTGGQWAGLLLLGSLGTAGHVFLIRSLALAPAALVAPFRYTRLIRVTALGFAVFGDFPGVDTLAGSALIVASGLYVVHREHRG